ncbi:MAG TPA: cation:proton antiporter [Amycolatopsis sp.]|nr:cation:proton antiporter [Amycolatopsis sp.]
MNPWGLPVGALVLLGYGALSARLRSTVVSRAMVLVAAGVLFGWATGLVSEGSDAQSVRVLAEATLAVVLFTDASGLPLGRLWRERALPGRLLGLGLPLTIGAGTLAAVVLFPHLNPWVAAALATVLAPTDAALILPVITDRRVPAPVREGLNVESGLNDGICVPLLIIFLIIAESAEHTEHGGPLHVVLTEIGYGVVAGIVAGAVGGWVLARFAARDWISPAWLQINAVVTPLLAYGAAVALGGSGFIAAFLAGSVYGTIGGSRAPGTTKLALQTGELLNALTFLVFGAVLLGPALGSLDWRIACYAIASLTVVRMLPVALALLGTGTRPPTVAFVGWFGPRGLASIVFVLILIEESSLPERGLILNVVTWTVALSVYVHGMTALPAVTHLIPDGRGTGPRR